jgi:putative transposase
VTDKKRMIEPGHSYISLCRQCELTGLNRSSYYYENLAADKPGTDSKENMQIMTCMDQQYIKTPSYGSRRMTDQLKLEGQTVNRKRIQHLMRQMGLPAIYPEPRLSQHVEEHKIYP